MRLLMLPFRVAAAITAWAIGSAVVIVTEAGVTRGHAPTALMLGASLLAVGLGAVVGAIVWRMSKSRPVQATGVLAVLIVAFVVAAVLSGAAVRG